MYNDNVDYLHDFMNNNKHQSLSKSKQLYTFSQVPRFGKTNKKFNK